MFRIRSAHILLCGFVLTLFPATMRSQSRDATTQNLPATYQKWLDEDVHYIITDEERADFAELTTDQQRDDFVRRFWENRNPKPGSGENIFKEEHYRRLAYVNEHFAAGVPGYKTDRGRIYILYGPPDEREQHPGRADIAIPGDAPAYVRYPSDVWRYHILNGVGRDVFFEFIDECRCGTYLLRKDPTKKTQQSKNGNT